MEVYFGGMDLERSSTRDTHMFIKLCRLGRCIGAARFVTYILLMWDHIDCSVGTTVMWGPNDPWWLWLKLPFNRNLQSKAHISIYSLLCMVHFLQSVSAHADRCLFPIFIWSLQKLGTRRTNAKICMYIFYHCFLTTISMSILSVKSLLLSFALLPQKALEINALWRHTGMLADNIPRRVFFPPFEASLCFLVRHQYLQKQSTVYQPISILVLSLSQICWR